jgi:hypothetical protein
MDLPTGPIDKKKEMEISALERRNVALDYLLNVNRYIHDKAPSLEGRESSLVAKSGIKELCRQVRQGDMNISHVGNPSQGFVVTVAAGRKAAQEDYIEAASGLKYWYRAMSYEEFNHLHRNGTLNLTPSKIDSDLDSKIVNSEKGIVLGRGSAPSTMRKEDEEDKSYIGIATHATYSRDYMGNNRTNNWLVEFHDEEGLLFDLLTKERATVKAEGGGTFGLGNQGSIPNGKCGMIFNDLLLKEKIDYRLIEAKIDLEEVTKKRR